MEGWTAQRVMQLAPDPASGKAGQGQANRRKWPAVGHDAEAVWGECQGSGAKPYQVQVDLSGPTFQCSCPSRKFPCKHGLGLMLMYAADAVTAGTRPAWVSEWLAARTERSEKKQLRAAEPPKPADPAAAAKRQATRAAEVGAGLASLQTWMADLVRGGIATVPGQGYQLVDPPARRMTDAKAPGVAARLRRLGDVAVGGAGWERPFVEGLASLHLLAAAHAKLDQLPPDTRDDVLATVGVPVPTDAVLARPAVADRWQVVGQEITTDDNLRSARTWLFGGRTRRAALVLAFAAGNAPLDLGGMSPGFAFDGELCFFPGTGPRAVVKARNPSVRLTDVAGPDTLDELCDWASVLNAGHPWLGEVAVPVGGLVPVGHGRERVLVDRQGKSLPAVTTAAAGWTLLAVSGGHPVDVTVAYDGRRLRPLGVLADGAFTTLVTNDAQ